jgi:hypothetical protein
LAILEKHEKSCQCEIEVSKVQVIQITAQFNFLLSQAKQCLAKYVAANKKKKKGSILRCHIFPRRNPKHLPPDDIIGSSKIEYTLPISSH